jgi:hypothetical protein
MYDQEREDVASKLVPLTGDTVVHKRPADNISDVVKLISKTH